MVFETTSDYIKYLLTTIPHFENHLKTFTTSLIICFGLEYFGNLLFSYLFPSVFNNATKLTKKDWNCHLVAFVHAVVVIFPSIYLYLNDPLGRYNIFDYNSMIGELHALSAGYFLWDTITSIQLQSLSFTAHGLVCLVMMFSSFRPFLMPFGPGFLIFEASTPFVNLNWFMDRVPGAKGTKFHLANGLCLIISFFFARIILGTQMVYAMFDSMIVNRQKLEHISMAIYLTGTVVLSTLNYYWFYLMIKKVRRAIRRSRKASLKKIDGSVSDVTASDTDAESPLSTLSR